MRKKLTLTCNEATTICDKSQYNEATFLEKMRLTVHFLYCKLCKRYTKQNLLLSTCYRNKAESIKRENYGLTVEEKETLKQALHKQTYK